MDNKNERKLRILFATPYKSGIGGGIARWADNVMHYYQTQKSSDFEIDVLPMGRNANFDVSSFVARAFTGLWEYSKIICKERRMLKSKQYDVLHLCSSASMSLLKDIVMIRMAKRFHVRTVIHFHFGRIPSLANAKNWEWKLLCHVVRMADVVVPIDQMSYDTLLSFGFSHARYLPNPLALAVSDFVQANEQDAIRDEKMVLYAGHCIKTKGIYELVRACSEIEGIKLVLAGQIFDETRKELEELSHGGPWLMMLGEKPHEEILRLMIQCGVYVLPSYTEGFPNVILESMCCGCAIVSTTVGAIPEMLGEENGRQYGLLVPPQDSEKLRQAIVRLLSDKVLRTECRKNARQRVNERYNMDSVWSRMTGIWRYAASCR
jgi:glycosyltransferase involved in cell wall biosynthesis